MNHEHRFERHVAMKIVGRRYTAWIPKREVSFVPWLWARPVDLPERWQCTDCGEQGYEVPA